MPEETEHKYKIPRAPYYVAILFIAIGIFGFFYKGLTLLDIHIFLCDKIKDDKIISGSILILVIIGLAHAILNRLKKSIDFYGKKDALDFYIWLSSLTSVIGTGFLAYSSLKIFCGLLGEKLTGIPFICQGNDGLISYSFIAITLAIIFFCAIKIGSMVGNIVELCKTFFHS